MQQVSAILTTFKVAAGTCERVSVLPGKVLCEFRNRWKCSSDETSERRFQQHFIPPVPKGVSYCFSLPWSLIMTDTRGAEFTYIIVSNRTGKRIFITGGGRTATWCWNRRQEQSSIVVVFSPPEIKHNHSLSFLNNIHFQNLTLPIYFISINVPCIVDLKTEMSRHLFWFYFPSKPV